MPTLETVLDSYLTFVVVGLVVGALLVPVAASSVSDSPAEETGTVAVVPVVGAIDGSTAAGLTARLQRARNDPDVDAVVLVISSPGGLATASAEMYLQVKRTAKEMPVVTAVDGAALSGGYYTLLPSDRVFVKPSSFVGSVGTLAPLPPKIEPQDVIGASGPNKLSGFDRREFLYQLDRVQAAFVGAVFAQRGENLTLSRTEVAEARIWTGADAVNNGIADEIGGQQAAVEHAARLAGLERYRVKVLPPGGTAQFLSRSNFLASDVRNKTMIPPSYFLANRTRGPIILMLPASYLAPFESRAVTASQAESQLEKARNATTNATTPTGNATGAGGDA